MSKIIVNNAIVLGLSEIPQCGCYMFEIFDY